MKLLDLLLENHAAAQECCYGSLSVERLTDICMRYDIDLSLLEALTPGQCFGIQKNLIRIGFDIFESSYRSPDWFDSQNPLYSGIRRQFFDASISPDCDSILKSFIRFADPWLVEFVDSLDFRICSQIIVSCRSVHWRYNGFFYHKIIFTEKDKVMNPSFKFSVDVERDYHFIGSLMDVLYDSGNPEYDAIQKRETMVGFTPEFESIVWFLHENNIDTFLDSRIYFALCDVVESSGDPAASVQVKNECVRRYEQLQQVQQDFNHLRRLYAIHSFKNSESAVVHGA